MAAPPWFKFYPDDFISGTYHMTNEEVGAYVRLLCAQWNRGSIPGSTAVQQRLAGGEISETVLEKFEADEKGNLRNARLESCREEASVFIEHQRQKGLASAAKRAKACQPRFNHGSTTVQPSPQPEVNQPEPEPEPEVHTPPNPQCVCDASRGNGEDPNTFTPDIRKPKPPDGAAFKLKAILNRMYRRGENDRWKYAEEHALLEIINRPAWDTEIVEIEASQKARGRYFPQSIPTLLDVWQKALDVARNQNNKPEKTLFQKLIDEIPDE